MKKAWFVTGAALGFILGSKAGTGPYDALEEKVREFTGRVDVRGAMDQVGGAVQDQAQELVDTANERLSDVADLVSDRISDVGGSVNDKVSDATDSVKQKIRGDISNKGNAHTSSNGERAHTSHGAQGSRKH